MQLVNFSTLWALDPRALPSVLAAARQARLNPDRKAATSPATPKRQTIGKVGVIPLHNLIEQKQSFAGWLMGGTSTEDFNAALDEMVRDPTVSAVVIDVFSPGGTSYGLIEASNRIYDARQRKPIYAVSNSLNASAALWISSSATKLFAAPGSETGSVGVYAMHLDASGEYEAAGLKPTIIQSTGSPFKTEWSDTAPLSPDAKAREQLQVDATHREFVNMLARNRGVSYSHVAENFGKGRTLSARDALSAGMVDGIQTLDETIKMAQGVKPGSSRQQASEDWRVFNEMERKRSELRMKGILR